MEEHNTEAEPKETIHHRSLRDFKTPGIMMTDDERKLIEACLDDRKDLVIESL